MIWSGETELQRRNRLEKGIRRFALFPTQMDDGTWVWLEYYWSALQIGHSRFTWWCKAIIREDAIYTPPKGPPPPPTKKR